jgi:hypothetical protein
VATTVLVDESITEMGLEPSPSRRMPRR